MDYDGVSRRQALAGAAGVALGTIAGCLGDDDDGTVLDPPERWDQLQDMDTPRPIHGDELPETTVPAPLADRDVTTTEFVGDRHAMFTFIFTRCSMACPALTSNLVQAQATAAEHDATDEFAFLPVTFDPEYDTPAELEAYAGEQGVDRDAGNWWFLRPESQDRARDVVDDTFGVHYEYVPEEDREMENMAWSHANVIYLVNEDGIVERMYSGDPPSPATIATDVETLLDRW